MKTSLILIAILAALTSVTATAEDVPTPTAKRCCHGDRSAGALPASIPVETGKGSCKAHPASCK